MRGRWAGRQVWFPTDSDMAECDSCKHWVHFGCDRLAGEAGEADEDELYYCPGCRGSDNVRGKTDKLYKLEQQLAQLKPERAQEPMEIFWDDVKEYAPCCSCLPPLCLGSVQFCHAMQDRENSTCAHAVGVQSSQREGERR